MDEPIDAGAGAEPPAGAEPHAHKLVLVPAERVEMFSDAVFAISMTLLVLDLQTPVYRDGQLLATLGSLVTAYAAFAASFVYVGTVWLNHHMLWRQVRSVDIRLALANLLVLGATAIIPFPTRVLSTALDTGDPYDQRVAALLFTVNAGLIALATLPTLGYLRRHPELIDPDGRAAVAGHRRPVLVVAAGATAAALIGWYVSVAVSVVVLAVTVIYSVITAEGVSHRTNRAPRFKRLRARGAPRE